MVCCIYCSTLCFRLTRTLSVSCDDDFLETMKLSKYCFSPSFSGISDTFWKYTGV